MKNTLPTPQERETPWWALIFTGVIIALAFLIGGI